MLARISGITRARSTTITFELRAVENDSSLSWRVPLRRERIRFVRSERQCACCILASSPKGPPSSVTYSVGYIPAPRDRRSDGLRVPRRRRALNSNETARKPLEKARQSTNAGRRAQPSRLLARLGADEIPDSAILRDVRVGFRAFRWEFPAGELDVSPLERESRWRRV